MEGEKRRFLRKHEKEIAPLIPNGEELSVEDSLERFETKILTWERKNRTDSSKRIMLEAAEPLAYQIVRPFIERLERDDRCGGLVLLTDNVSGSEFTSAEDELHLTRTRTPDTPVLADIPGNIDATLVVTEPRNSPDKLLLYSGKSVYGNESSRLYYLLEGIPGIDSRELFASQNLEHMDRIDTVFVWDELSARLVRAALPELSEKVEVTGSPLLTSKADTFPTKESKGLIRKDFLEHCAVTDDAIVVFYSGFPSVDYEEAKEGQSLNQKTFAKTLEAITNAARKDERRFVFVIREHPRARGGGDQIGIIDELPPNLKAIFANGNEFSYEQIANASDFIVCQSTSSEVSIAPYRGSVAVVSGYEGMQEELNQNIFGAQGLAILKDAPDLVYCQSPIDLQNALLQFRERKEPRPVPMDSFGRIIDRLVGDE